MLQLSSYFARRSYEMVGIFITEDIQGLFESVLLDLAVGCKVSTGGAVIDEVVLGQEALSSYIVARRKVYLGQEEGIVCIP